MAEATKSRPERLQVMLGPEELAAVEDFRFQNRMPSRAEAMRELLKRDLRLKDGLQRVPSQVVAVERDEVERVEEHGVVVAVNRPDGR